MNRIPISVEGFKRLEKEVDKVVTATIADFRKKEASLDELIFDTKKVILERIKAIAGSLKNPYALSTLLTALKDYEGQNEGGPAGPNSWQTFIDKQVIINNHEKDNNPNQDH